MGNVQVFRYTLRADLARLLDQAALPEEIRIPCSRDSVTRPHTFFYGYLDLARDALNPADPSMQRRALALVHAPGRLSHAEVDETFKYTCDSVNVSRRPLPPCGEEAHDEAGWFVVAPATGGFAPLLMNHTSLPARNPGVSRGRSRIRSRNKP